MTTLHHHRLREICLCFAWLWLPSLALSFDDTKQAADEQPVPAPSLKAGMEALRGSIEKSLEERQTLVTWLIDKSVSLNGRRAELADFIDSFHSELESKGDDRQLATLKSAVIAFGRTVDFLTPEPIEDAAKVSDLIRNIIPDESGDEETFSAVLMASDQYRRLSGTADRHNILFVIFTDERGDDYLKAPEAAKHCEKLGIRVFCLGNVAPFGREKGYVRFRYADGFEQNIPVDQGPESMRIELVQTPWVSTDRISSGFGPFSLEMLCRQTDGKFFPVADSALHRFAPQVMKKYTPIGVDVASIRVFQKEVSGNPAMAAVLLAAEITRKQNLVAPHNLFRADKDSVLRGALTDSQRRAALLEFRSTDLLRILEEDDVDRSSLNTPRWKAVFDLTLGRVLATRARSLGYNLRLAQMKVKIRPFKKEGSNSWGLTPEPDAVEGAVIQKMAARAIESLERVVAEHPGTPFAFVAEQELKYGFGWKWVESSKEWPDIEARPRGPSDEWRIRPKRKLVPRRRPKL